MLEIFLLIYLARRTKGIVEPKGYKPGKWQAYAILLWIGTEMFGILLSRIFFNSDTIVAVFSGLLTAVATALIFQKRIENLPDLNTPTDEWLNNMGNDHYNS